MVYRRSRVSRTTFNRLPNGAIYFDASGNGPYVKMNRTARMTANTQPTTNPVGTTVSPVNQAVERVTKAALKSQNLVV